MRHYVGLDCGKRKTHICVLDDDGLPVRQTAVESLPEAILRALRVEDQRYSRVGVEASTSPWLVTRLRAAGLPLVCIETRHGHAILKTRTNKTDKTMLAAVPAGEGRGRWGFCRATA